MVNYMAYIRIRALFAALLLGVSTVVGSRTTAARNKSTPFECGFDPKDSARLPFSMRFFLLAVVFLIFDIEVALLFPVVLGIKLTLYGRSLVAAGGFLIILLFGLLHEWFQGSLRWVL